MLSRDIIDPLFPSDVPEPAFWEDRYPPRPLPPGAKVTRFAPSPTGFVHIGGVYVATISKDMARHSGGVYFIRIEDTDRARIVKATEGQFTRAFRYFAIESEEHDDISAWGPYNQSARQRIYLTYVRHLLREGKAYPCFCSKEALAQMAEEQRRTKSLLGYYGQWARCRDLPADHVTRRLRAGEPYVVRFRSPGHLNQRVSYIDHIRGPIDQTDNRNDAVILKTSADEPRLPTYHFAHAVDDHLMRVTLVIRGEEWIPSVPLHTQLFDALGFDRVDYAHIAPLMKQDGSSKRKLSKRKDSEASVDFYISGGYPSPSVQYYLRGLANSRLAEMPLRTALREPIQLAACGIAGPLVDMAKLNDISKDYIASLPAAVIIEEVLTWAREYDAELGTIILMQRDLAERAVDVERAGVANPRKDLARWSDFRQLYGFFFPELFELVADPEDERFHRLDPGLVRLVAHGFREGYKDHEDKTIWFGQVRAQATEHGFSSSVSAFRANPSAYHGSISEVANIIRVLLTGATQTPDLHAIARALGPEEVARRVGAMA